MNYSFNDKIQKMTTKKSGKRALNIFNKIIGKIFSK